jgi:glutamate/aspartate transport system permease protein
MPLDPSVFLKPAIDGSANYGVYLLAGLGITVILSLASWVVAFLVGSMIGVFRTLPNALLRFLGACYVELFRNVPLLVQLFIWYFVVPELIPGFGSWFKNLAPGLQMFASATLCFGLFTGARVAEQVRAGIGSLARGQYGAGLALGLKTGEVYRLILLPVAYRILVPPLTSEFLNLIKNTAVASTIGLIELTQRARSMGEQTSKMYESFIAATVLYVVLNLSVMAASHWLEKRVRLKGTVGGV